MSLNAAFLVPDNPEKAVDIFKSVLSQIARVRYNRPKKPRPTQPRVNRRSRSKWRNNLSKYSALIS